MTSPTAPGTDEPDPITLRLATVQKAAAAPQTDAGGAARGFWYLGSMNDGLFIIDTRPSTSGTDTGPWDNPNGPTIALNVVALKHNQAQAIVDGHNTSMVAKDAEIERLRAEVAMYKTQAEHLHLKISTVLAERSKAAAEADEIERLKAAQPEPVRQEPFKRCTICGSPLDVPDRPWSLDCGGDCLACIDEAEIWAAGPVAQPVVPEELRLKYAEATQEEWLLRDELDGSPTPQKIVSNDGLVIARFGPLFGRPHAAEGQANAELCTGLVNWLRSLLASQTREADTDPSTKPDPTDTSRRSVDALMTPTTQPTHDGDQP